MSDQDTTPPALPPAEPAPAASAPRAAMPAPLPDAHGAGWQRLPPRAKRMFLLVAGLSGLIPVVPVASVLFGVLDDWSIPERVALVAGIALVVIGFALWLGVKRYTHTAWKLDVDGFAVRRGRLWQTHTHVPASRVQHLDLKRGPIERRYGLATLVLHTAGTRLNAVQLSGMEDADAEALRDHFSRLTDRHDDDELDA